MVAEGTPDSVDPSVLDEEEGLPSPPLDDLAFFAAPTAGIELSQVLSFSHSISNLIAKLVSFLFYHCILTRLCFFGMSP